MARYSRNLKGKKVGWIAREKVGRRWTVVARGDTLEEVQAVVEGLEVAVEEPAVEDVAEELEEVDDDDAGDEGGSASV